jgi:hypothetical protein
MRFICANCGVEADRPSGQVNRAINSGLRLFCGRQCAGVGRRKPPKTIEQRKAEKAEYDRKRREEYGEQINAKKRAYHKATYDPKKAAEHRKTRMPHHIEYCRQPAVKAKKKTYDRKHRAEKKYGDLAECFVLVMEIRDECLSQMTDYEIRVQKGTINKALKRRRDYERLDREEPEIGALGNLDRGERW